MRASWNVWSPGILCSVGARASTGRGAHQIQTTGKKKKTWATPEATFLLGLGIAGFFETAVRTKHPLPSTSKNNENYQRKKAFSFIISWGQEAEQRRLAQPACYLTEVTRASGNQCQLRQIKSEQVWAWCTHRCLEIADCCGLEWKLPPTPSRAVIWRICRTVLVKHGIYNRQLEEVNRITVAPHGTVASKQLVLVLETQEDSWEDVSLVYPPIQARFRGQTLADTFCHDTCDRSY